MSTTFINAGDVMEFPAPAGGVTSGTLYLVGGFPGIAQVTAAATVVTPFYITGNHTLPKTTGEGGLVVGQAAYWDATNAKVTIDPSLGLPIGAISAAALTGDTTCQMRLNGSSIAGRVLNVRKRFSVAQVNAGATLLPAITGCKYRMISATAIAIGGAATTVTTVDILATLSAASRKLVAFAQASLTQSTVLKDGGTGAAVLADGASYTANDVSTAVTVGVTGAGITVATSIDFDVVYALE